MKKITENASVFTIIILICSLFKNVRYYENWNIDILNYVDFSELLFLIISDLSLFLLFLLGLYITYLIQISLYSELYKQVKQRKITFSYKKFFESKYKSFIFLLIILYSLTNLFSYFPNKFTLFILTGFVFYFFCFIPNNFIKNISEIYYLFALLISMLLLGYLKARLDISNISVNKNLNNTFYINGKAIKTNNKFYLIGMVKNYIFFFDVNTKSAIVYKNNFEKIEIPN